MDLKTLISLSLIMVIHSELKVIKPDSLISLYPEGINYSLGNFGFVPYGQTLTALLQPSNPSKGCTVEQDPASSQQYQGSRVVLIERGNCTFGEKSYNAELKGFSMSIIADNTDENINSIQMVDRNHSNQVNIPTIMISHIDGDKIQNFFKTNPKADVYIRISFQKPNVSDVVAYQYWLSSMDQESFLFISQFKPFHNLMQNNLTFTPHYPLWYCLYCKTAEWALRNDDCLSGGRYCAYDPDFDGPLKGQDAVWHTLRQLCVNKVAPKLWWDYMDLFGKQCLGYQENSTAVRDTQGCAEQALTNVSISVQDVKKCMDDSFVGGAVSDPDLADNIILSQEREAQLLSGISSYPLLVVNGEQYRVNSQSYFTFISQGALSLPFQNNVNVSKQVFDTAHYGPLQLICNGFSNYSMPQICKERQRMYIDEQGNLKNHEEGFPGWAVWTISVFGLVILMLLTIYCYRRQMRVAMQKELQLQVNMAISQYFSLNEKEKGFIELK